MTAHLLPSVVFSPFARHFDSAPGVYHGSTAPYSQAPDNPSSKFNQFFIHENEGLSSASIFSIASAPAPAPDENADPLNLDILCSPPKRSASDQAAASTGPGHGIQSISCGHVSRKSSMHHMCGNAAGRGCSRPYLTELFNQRGATSTHNRKDRPRGERRFPARVVPFDENSSATFSTRQKTLMSKEEAIRTTTGLLQQPDQLSQRCERPVASRLVQPDTAGLSPEPRHQKRHSTASSGFVHTIKTASLSNASFSLVPLSTRFGRSTDSSTAFGSNQRYSTDSDRPVTNSSMDEAAFRRGLKRRQIIGELITTEESYVADLKALIYVYSTLLATSFSIPGNLRASAQRNIADLLHTHERLLGRLHEAAYEAAARNWADTSSPQTLRSLHRHRRWRSLESKFAAKITRPRRRTHSSVDSAEKWHGRAYLGCAEPRDVSEIATLFRDNLNDFFAYEEYCANHGLIAHELQKQAPPSWPMYEAGMESLAKSLVALDQRKYEDRKGLTVADLLIKPIQRLTKYPLLFEDLLRQTPVADCPSAHTDLETTILCLREVVKAVNEATDSLEARTQAQRRWAVQSRLNFDKVLLRPEHFRALGDVRLCGVLHVAWQTRCAIDGGYAVSILFDSSLVLALQAPSSSRLDIIAFLQLSDVKIESASDGRGLQCHSTLHTFKICAQIGAHLHEFVVSACSAVEESVWRDGLQGKYTPSHKRNDFFKGIFSSIGLDLRSVGVIYGPQTTGLTRHPSVQRAATVGNRANTAQVIVRNTHNPQDLHEFRQNSTASINRSQSHMTSNRIVVLSPKRSERARLESSLANVWTKDRLPYPGIIGSRGGQIIRASAGSLARKLSLASIHAPFSRRSGSISIVSRKSYETATEGRRSRRKTSPPVFEVRKESFEELPLVRKKSHEMPELDTMDTLVNRMIGSGSYTRSGLHHSDNALCTRGTVQRTASASCTNLEAKEPHQLLSGEEKEKHEKDEAVEQALGGRRKRWSNPLGILKGLSAEGFRHMLYSSK